MKVSLRLKEALMGSCNNAFIGVRKYKELNYTLLYKIQKLINNGHSFLLTEVSGDLYSTLCDELKDKGYQVYCLDLRNPLESDSWNALYYPYTLYKQNKYLECLDALESVSSNIILDEENLKRTDPFWAISAKDFLVGLSYCLFEDAPYDECVNLKSIQSMVNEGMGKFGGSTYIKEYFALKEDSDYGKQAALSVLQAPSDTYASIMSVFNQKLKSITVKNTFLRNICNNTIDLKEVITQKSAVFIRVEDEKTEASQYVHIFIKQLYEELIQEYYADKKAQNEYTFIFNDFLSLGKIHDIEKMLLGAPKRNIDFTFVIQGISALECTYGQDLANMILGSCDTYIIYNSMDLRTLKYIKDLCKNRGLKKGKKNFSEGIKEAIEISLSGVRELTAYQKPDIIYKVGKSKVKSYKDYQPSVFNIQEKVKETKKKRLVEMMRSQNDEEDNDERSPAERLRALIEDADA